MHREEYGAVHFWRIKENLQSQFPHSPLWSDDRSKACLAAGGGARRRYQYCTDASGTIIYFRALHGHSGRNLIDPSLQDNVTTQSKFFQYIYLVGCAINLRSIINSGLLPGSQKLSNRQTVFFLPVDPMDKVHKDPDTIDLEAPRLAQYMHKAWKKHQNTVYWVDINFALKKGLKLYRTRSNAIILHETLPACCIPKVVRMESGGIIYEKVYASPRLLPKISLEDNWMKELDSEVARGSEVSQQIKPKTQNPTIKDGRLVSEQPSCLLTKEIEKDVLFGTNSRTGETCECIVIQPELCANVC